MATICLGILLAACGGGASSADASQATPSVSQSPEATTAGPSGVALPSLPSSAKDLEALIPDKVGDIALQKLSMQGDEFVSSGGATKETEKFLEGLGVDTDAVAVAAGFGSAAETGDALVVFVFRAEGAGTDRLVTVFKEALDSDRSEPLAWEGADVGGKQVERATDPEQAGQVYLYAQGDVLFYLAATREEDAAEALETLP
jgi:hypothetical protein